MVAKYNNCLKIVLSLVALLVPVFSVQAAYYPVVIVPGMLASFDKKLMYQDKEDNKWSFVPFGNVYKALIKTLENDGYEEGKSLFIAHYDWRKPVSENWQKYLKPKIDEAKQKSGQNKVDLVAHSMGGLLSRAYIQNDNYGNDVNKLVMMGTPNYGASESYVAWEGGLYPKSWNAGTRWYANTIQNSLKKVRNKQTLTRPSTFREFFPALRDLLPTTPFAKNGNNLLALSSMADKNDFLIGLNNNVSIVQDRVGEVETYSGLTGKTMGTITLGETMTEEDINNLRWRDGHPDPDPPTANSDQGDETVLLSSATIPNIYNQTFEGTSHTKIPDSARSSVSWFLNPAVQVQAPISSRLAASFSSFSNRFANIFTVNAQVDDGTLDEYVAPNAMLSFTVSPNVNFTVTDPDGKILSRDINELGEDNAYFDDDPSDNTDIVLVVIKNPKAGKYTLTLNGNSAGDYYVDSTFVNDNGNFESSNEGTITQQENKTLEATVSETGGVVLPSSVNKIAFCSIGAEKARIKLSSAIIYAQSKLMMLLYNKKASEPKITRAAYQTLTRPLNDMLMRVWMCEAALRFKKTKLATSLSEKIQEDYSDFEKDVDKLIAGGKLNKQTVDVLTALKQRLETAGLK
jgi:hypothetical protein